MTPVDPTPPPALVMYVTSWCGDCALARRFLKARGIGWTERDVDEDVEAEARVLAHNADTRHLPVFECKGEMLTVSPFDRARLADWLLRLGAASPNQLSGAAPADPET